MDVVLTALASGRPLVPITGPAGIGRTTALTMLGEVLARHGAWVTVIRFTRTGDVVPVRLSRARPGFPPIGPVAGAHRDPEIARRAAAAVAAVMLRGEREALLLVDDAQWIDEDSRAVLGALVRRLAGTGSACVCAIRTPFPAHLLAWLRDLRGAALVAPARLRPMTAIEVARTLAAVTRARPHDELVARVRELSRGIPAAVHDAIEALRHNGAVRSAGGRAYLETVVRPLEFSPGKQSLRCVRGLRPEASRAATAVSVFAPLGVVVPRLVAEVLETSEPEAGALLADLCREGVLHRGRHGHSWRIPVPALAGALTAAMGPFERKQLSARAVTAVWADEASCADPDRLADLVAEAGGLIDPVRAFDTLLERATEVGVRQSWRAARWLATAIDLAQTPARRAASLLAYTEICHARGFHDRSLRGAQLLLTGFADQLTPDVAQELQVIAVRSLRNTGDEEFLRKIAESCRGWQEDPRQRPVTRALALGMLDRWGEVRAVLGGSGPRWRAGSATTVLHGSLLEAQAALWTGHSALFEGLPERDFSAPANVLSRVVCRRGAELAISRAAALLVLGDAAAAAELLAVEDPGEVPLGHRAALAALRGEAGLAVELAGRAATSGARGGDDIGYSAMQQAIISMMVAQGKLTAAREALTSARQARPRLGYLLDLAEARICHALGEGAAARVKLAECAQTAAERGLAVGTDLCLAEITDLALQAGDFDEAKRCLIAIEGLARTMPTSRVRLHAALIRSLVNADRPGAAKCLELARERGQPFEIAMTTEKLVRHGVAKPMLLIAAYEHLGEFDARLYRSWLRNLMREHSVVVPGRARTAVESEHLLAVLVADGLTNKQLAMALRVSEKSVENRLSRLFARTGYRSRIELSAAMQDGAALAGYGAVKK
ncbi:LuxR family transcriptional regulator [Amycolatopsis sp. PS_44_ISF1]|uniref:ATP-binding protein n=1 Tax=Amycolatopsis sp. PS_44_ISF1 TaxID=2974917 RepID=UPI0028DF2E94|nr:LuxR family transcriptional regulator [Amycolatopsis sp. PS_44_ISF1]MDT8912062.1 LuxR family transcriptional regulator [Amycolatopsis sp. PS_44_ISF1]